MSIQPSTQRRIWWYAAAALVAMTVALMLVIQKSPTAQASAPEQVAPPTPVSVATVEEQDISVWEEFSGRLEAVDRVDIRSRVAGVVQSTHFGEGTLVAKGALLVTIDPAPYEAEVARAAAQTSAAQARLTHAGIEYKRSRQLWGERAIAERELDDRENVLREAEAKLKAAQAQLETARLSLGYTQVRAPVAGRIGKLEVTVGNLIAAGPGAPVITTLVSVSPIYASFDVDEKTVLGALKNLGGGTKPAIERIPVRMNTLEREEAPHVGRLQLIDNQVDFQSGTVRVRAVFDNRRGNLIPGQFARIRMGQPQTTRTVLVNERAIGTNQDRKYVLVVGEGDKTEYRVVTLGTSVDGLRIVLDGLVPGERIVVNGLQQLRPGVVVHPQPVPMNTRSDALAAQGAAGSRS